MTIANNFRSDHMLWIASTVLRCGNAIISVGSGQCSVPGCRCDPEPVPWSYTIGLCEQGNPEFVMFGVHPVHALPTLNWASDRARSERGVEPGDFDRFDEVRVRFDLVPPAWVLDLDDDPMGQWWAHYGVGAPTLEPPDVLQLVWADADDNFPDDPGRDPDVVAVQPVGTALLANWRSRTPLSRQARRQSRKRRR